MKRIYALFILIAITLFNFSPAFAIKEDENIEISRNYVHLGSRLHKEYQGVIYNITNKSNQNIEIVAVSLEDNLTSSAAYFTVKRSSTKMALKILGNGLLYAIPTLSLSLVGGVIITPFAMISNSIGNVGAKQDSKRYDKSIGEITLIAGEAAELRTIGMKNKHPKITVLYKLQSDESLHELKY